MPILTNAKTVWVDDNPWESPDGKVKIWKIKLERNGERDTHSTMSKTIATEGWSGDIEVYTNAKGKDYVRQAPKEEQGSHGGKREWKDTSDGQRQGMCFNNAATYVAAKSEETLTPHKWADAVFNYATALYSKGDLLNMNETKTEEPEPLPEPPREEPHFEEEPDLSEIPY